MRQSQLKARPLLLACSVSGLCCWACTNTASACIQPQFKTACFGCKEGDVGASRDLRSPPLLFSSRPVTWPRVKVHGAASSPIIVAAISETRGVWGENLFCDGTRNTFLMVRDYFYYIFFLLQYKYACRTLVISYILLLLILLSFLL